jgi:hypothetical protein
LALVSILKWLRQMRQMTSFSGRLGRSMKTKPSKRSSRVKAPPDTLVMASASLQVPMTNTEAVESNRRQISADEKRNTWRGA